MVEQRDLLGGIVEVDETYVGGKPRKRNDGTSDEDVKRGRGTKKVPVVGVIERGGSVKAEVALDLKAKSLSTFIRDKVEIEGATVITDEFSGYAHLKYLVKHEVINHSEGFACGNIHTNSIESFWAILNVALLVNTTK